MSEHFIKNIEIKDFKCFKDFKAEGFGRVNLIGGKNNVGKTALMEACLLGSVEKNSKDYVEFSIIIEMNRNSLDFLLQWIKDYKSFEFKYKNSHIAINSSFTSVRVKVGSLGEHKQNKILIMYGNALEEVLEKGYVEKCDCVDGIVIESWRTKTLDKKILSSLYKKGEPPLINNSKYISIGNNFNKYLVDFIDEIKLADREEDLNNTLKSFFDIEKIDIIKNKVMLKKDSKYLLLSAYGDGVKHFLNIILALYLNKNSILYLDELESGIHYTNYDKLWELILTISKEQNVQVFATTHSKECIESYARVAKKLEENNKIEKEDIKLIELGRTKENKIDSIIYTYEWLIDEIEQNHEVRGW